MIGLEVLPSSGCVSFAVAAAALFWGFACCGSGEAMEVLNDARLEHYHEHGFVILRDVLGSGELKVLRDALQPYLDLEVHGRNDFEGERTRRVYSLVGRGKCFEQTAEHPDVLGLVDELLHPNYLLTASQAICIDGDETPQPLHSDDQFCFMPRPRPPVSVSTIWALDDFEAANGATEIIPGSHVWTDEQADTVYREGSAENGGQGFMPVEMSAGSLVLFAGTLYHRGGASAASTRRRAFSHQYCQPWVRPQENFTMSIPKERVRTMSARLRGLLGYSIHPPFIGQIAGRHPEKALAEDFQNSLIADDAAIAADGSE